MNNRLEDSVKEKMDFIDMLMLNDINNNLILQIEENILQLNDMMSTFERNTQLYGRFEILCSAVEFKKTGKVFDEISAENVKKYYDWMDSIKDVVTKENITVEEALKSQKVAEESGHDVQDKVKEIIERNQSLKKVTIFDSIRAKFSSIFNKKKDTNFTKEQKNANIRDEYKIENFESKQQFKEETIVISDIHGNMEKWKYVKNMLRENPKRKLIIEGDAMDRGAYGVEILMQIKELCDLGKAEYLPGNHDVFAYNSLKTENTPYENTPISRNSKLTWEKNGGKITKSKFDDFEDIMKQELTLGNIKKQITKEELVDWLGRQPIQKVHKENDITYALSHAMFDTKLYNTNSNFNLQDALNLGLQNNKDNELLKRFNNCMWYREKEENTHMAELSWPKDCVVVVGHTKQTKTNLGLINGDPYKSIIYLDCGKGKLQGLNLSTASHIQIEPERENSEKALQR